MVSNAVQILYVLLIFGLVLQSINEINERDMLQSIMIMELSIFSFNIISICFMYFEGPMLNTYIFMTIMSF